MDFMDAITSGVIRPFGPFAEQNGFIDAIASGVIKFDDCVTIFDD